MKYLIITLLIYSIACLAENSNQLPNNLTTVDVNNTIQSVSEERIWSNDGTSFDAFGRSVSVDGDYVVVGTPGISRSAVYIYKISNGIWRQTAQLKTSLDTFRFGQQVSIFGNIVLVSDATSLFVFNRQNDETWELTQQINIPFANLVKPIDSIDLDANSLIVGVKKANNNNIETGRAAIYNFNGTFWQFKSDLIANNGVAGDEFGKSVSLLNGRALIGAPLANNQTGAAYLFELNNSNQWQQEEFIAAGDVAVGDQFGYSVAISDDFLFIGSPFDNNPEGAHAGALYVFNFPGSVLFQFSKLILNDNIMHFGGSIAYSNNKIVVGTLSVPGVIDPRKAYVFAFDGFTWGGVIDVINPVDNQIGHQFAQSVAIDNDRIAIGASSDNVVTIFQDVIGQGSAYIIEKNPTLPFWDSYIKISLNEATTQDQYGTSVSVSGDYAVIGAPYDDQVGEDSGAVYTYKKVNDKWLKLAKILPPDLTTLDLFGMSVSIEGSFMVVGAPNAKIGAFGRTGAVYFYQLINDVWQPIGRFNANDKQDLAEFGFSVSVKGSLALIGAPYDDNIGINDTGAAYLFNYIVDNNTGIGRWGQKKKFIASDAEFLDRFGYSVSLDQWAAIGAFSEDGNTAGNAGAVYLYKEVISNSFIETKLQSKILNAGNAFGYSVSISNNHLVVGAKGTENGSGSVEFFTEDNLVWSSLSFTLQGLNQGDNLGYSVAIDSNQVTTIGAPQINNAGKGYAVLFDLNTFDVTFLTTSLDLTAVNDRYGYSVSTSGSQHFVGASLFEFNGFNGGNNGIVHVFTDLPDAMFSDGFE